MTIRHLVIRQFRNLHDVTIQPHTGINIFYGQNGSGKTSILEAIYFLGLGRSFRTHLIQRIIHEQSNQLLVLAQLQQGSQTQPVGVERTRQGEKKIRINGETIASLAPLVKKIPLQLLTTESHRYFHDGPKSRRQFLDWGVFHVEHDFYSTWQQFQKALQQRNASLKSQRPSREVEVWNHDIVRLSDLLDQMRKNYILELQPVFTELLEAVLPEPALQLHYYRGWSREKEIAEVLTAGFSRDQQLGYTQFGPQRADLQLYAAKIPAGDFLSQGQQKLAAYALHLAQGLLLQQRTTQSPIYLIDDLPSELDPEKRQFVMSILNRLKAQIFITAITLNELSDMISHNPAKTFHVEHGKIHVPRGT